MTAAETRQSKLRSIDWSVYPIVDPEKLPADRNPADFARSVFEAGANILQVRDKRDLDRRTFELSQTICQIAEDYSASVIINDRADIAEAVGADGVHLGPEDLPVRAVRRIVPDLLIGGSAGTPQRARALEEAGADYLGVGAVYDAGPSKPDASDPRGPEIIRSVVRAVDIPVIGIGGITPDNAASVAEAGAAGVAVIRSASRAANPKQAIEQLQNAFC